jgi:hypothetical protein
MMMLVARCAALALVTSVVACAGKLDHDRGDASARASEDALLQMQQRMGSLEARVAQLEATRAEREPAPAPAPQAGGWSCVAKCGAQSTQTTEPRIVYERVTGQGVSVAAAYQDMVDHCAGTIYERFEDGRMVGGEMRSVCMQDAGAATP